jgi:hypothetical protein
MDHLEQTFSFKIFINSPGTNESQPGEVYQSQYLKYIDINKYLTPALADLFIPVTWFQRFFI